DGIRDFHVTGVQTCALPILIDERYFYLKTCKPDALKFSQSFYYRCRLLFDDKPQSKKAEDKDEDEYNGNDATKRKNTEKCHHSHSFIELKYGVKITNFLLTFFVDLDL